MHDDRAPGRRAGLRLALLAAATLTACGSAPRPARPVANRVPASAAAFAPAPSPAVPAPPAPILPVTSATGPAPVPPPPAAAPAARVGDRNRLVGPGIDTAVVPYTDCYGNAAVPRVATVLVTCSPTRWYFAGHNPGLFTPLMGYTIGEEITYWDGAGVSHTLRVVAIRDGLRATPWVPRARSDVVAQFQTCETAHPEGGIDRFIDAVEV